MTSFIPRTSPDLGRISRAYFLGHHAAGLRKMKAMLSSVDLVIECRDYRIPLTSQNPLLNENLAGKERLVVYTKQDLGSQGTEEDRRREEMIRRWHSPSPVLFSAHKNKTSGQAILQFARERASAADSLTGSRMLVVGMPNVGKSTLLNDLRKLGRGEQKAARTGAQPGITRKIASSVKILEDDDGSGKVYLIDTPGVFMPYVPDAEGVLKLALCAALKDALISPITVADYLLYHLNLNDPELYSKFSQPTNDVESFLSATAYKTGRIQRGGSPDTQATALWMVQRWRDGLLGRFLLDRITEDGLERRRRDMDSVGRSLNQARREEKRQRGRQKSPLAS